MSERLRREASPLRGDGRGRVQRESRDWADEGDRTTWGDWERVFLGEGGKLQGFGGMNDHEGA